jgi:transposase
LDRSCLTDAQWNKIADVLPGKPGDPGRSGTDNRQFVEAVLWIARTGAPWRDLPASFGNWNSVFKRFRRWASRGVFERMFKALRGDPDFEYVIADGTISRVHQKATGAKVGLSHITKQLLEERFAPGGHLHFACDGSFVGVSP